MHKIFKIFKSLALSALLVLLFSQSSVKAAATVPFTCDTNLYFVSGVDSTTPSTIARYSLASSTITPQTIGTASDAVNAVGYRTQDNFLYAMGRNTDNLNHLYKFDSAGGETDLGLVSGMDQDYLSLAGAFAADGYLYVINGRDTNTTMYKINVVTVSASEITMTDSFDDMFDIAYNPSDNLLYGYDSNNGGGAGQLASISLTGTVTHFGPGNYTFGDMGAVWTIENRLYGAENPTGIIRQFDINPTSSSRGDLVGSTFSSPIIGDQQAQHDGANCPNATFTTSTTSTVTPELPDTATQGKPASNKPWAAVLLSAAIVGFVTTVVFYAHRKLQTSKQPKK